MEQMSNSDFIVEISYFVAEIPLQIIIVVIPAKIKVPNIIQFVGTARGKILQIHAESIPNGQTKYS